MIREQSFLRGLMELMEDHGVYLSGEMRLIDGHGEKWDLKTFRCDIAPEVTRSGIKDSTGPFLVASIQEKPVAPVNCNLGFRPLICGDIEPYTCPVTGKVVGGRAQHRDNLKRHNCRILEKGDKEWARKKRDESFNESVEKTVHEAVAQVAKEF